MVSNDYETIGLLHMDCKQARDYLNEIEEDYRLGLITYKSYCLEHHAIEMMYPDFYYNMWLTNIF